MANPDEPKEFHPIKTKGIALCPMAVGVGGAGTFSGTHTIGSQTWRVEGLYGTTFTSWEISSFSPPFRCSYGLNSGLFPPTIIFSNRFFWHERGRYYLDLFSIKGNAGIPVLLDSVKPAVTPRDDAVFGRPPPYDKNTGYWPFCINRHNGFVNGLFLDWSVRKIGLKGLWTLKWNPEFDTAGPWTKAGGVTPEDWPQWMRGLKDY